MKKRTLIALALVLAVALVAQTGVWADKLQTGVEAAPVASSNAGARPAGTVTDADGGIIFISEADDVTIALYTGDAQGPSGDAFLVEVNFNEASRVLIVELGPDGGTVSYWDGEAWVELEVVDGTVTVPDDVPDPVLLAAVLN